MALDDKAIMPGEAEVARARAAIDDYNARRPGAVSAARRNVLIKFLPYCVLAAAAGVLGFAAVMEGGAPEQILMSLGVFAAIAFVIGGFWLWRHCQGPVTRLAQDTRDRMLPELFSFAGKVEYDHGERPEFMDTMPVSALVMWTSVDHGDRVAGNVDGMAFELGECLFRRKQGKSTKTTFKGVAMSFSLASGFPGTLAIAQRTNAFIRFFTGNRADTHLDAVETGDAWADGHHDFRTDNAEAALSLLRGRLVKVLKWLDETWPGGTVRLVLNGDRGLLMVPSDKDFFELPHAKTEMDYTAHGEPLIRELATLIATAQLVRKAV